MTLSLEKIFFSILTKQNPEIFGDFCDVSTQVEKKFLTEKKFVQKFCPRFVYLVEILGKILLHKFPKGPSALIRSPTEQKSCLVIFGNRKIRNLLGFFSFSLLSRKSFPHKPVSCSSQGRQNFNFTSNAFDSRKFHSPDPSPSMIQLALKAQLIKHVHSNLKMFKVEAVQSRT